MNSPRYSIRLPHEWQDEIKLQASLRGLTPSSWIRKQVAKALPESVRASLPEIKCGPKRKKLEQ
tara:strand:- start:1000 stop:1191 length:192 start_codon:yes stop_codon:yes gene_type:complete